MTAGVLTVYYTGSLQFYGGVNFIILPTVKRSDNHFIIMNRGQKTLQEYKSINDLLPLHFIIQIFQKSFMSFANHKHQNYFLHWNYQIKISKHKFKVIHYLALLYKHLHVLNHHPLNICQHLIFNKYWEFFFGFLMKKENTYLIYLV